MRAVVVAILAVAAVGAMGKDYGHHGAMGYGPLRPFDESTPTPRPVPCEKGKCTIDQKVLADLLKKVYEEGKAHAQSVCGSRT